MRRTTQPRKTGRNRGLRFPINTGGRRRVWRGRRIPRRAVEGSASGSTTIRGTRKLTLAPKHVKADGEPDNPWWIEGLKWVGGVVMKLLTLGVTKETVDRLLVEFPLPMGHPLLDGYLAGSVPIGMYTRLGLGPEDLVAESELARPYTGQTDTGKKYCAQLGYHQGRLKHLKVIVKPVSNTDNVSGTMAVAITPVTQDEMNEVFSTPPEYSLEDILKMPHVVYKSAETPTAITYVPKPGEAAFAWTKIGAAVDTMGGDRFLFVDVCYTNMASNTADMTSAYSMLKSLFEITFEATVQLKDIREVVIRKKITSYAAAESFVLNEYGAKTTIDLAGCYWHNGILLRRDDSALMSV